MKRFAVVAMFIIMFVAVSGIASAADGTKIGVINLQKILLNSKAGKDANASFQKEFEMKRNVLQNREKTAKSIEDDLKARGPKMKPAERAQKEESLAAEMKELRRLKTDMEEELKKTDARLTQEILKDVYEITKKLGEERGYNLIIQGSPQIVYIDNMTDITDEVLKRFDSKPRK